MNELNEAFEEETEETVITETEESTEGEEKAETEETETEEVESKESEEPASTEPKMVPLAAVQDERRKRQEIESRLKELESKVPKGNDEPDIYEDPDGWKEWNRNQILAEQTKAASEQLEIRINESREKMLESTTDFIQAEKAFLVLAQDDQEITQQMLNSLNPAQFAYEKGKEFLKTLVEPEFVGKKPEVPVSLAKASAKGANTVEVEEEDDLKGLFADQNY